MQHLAEAFAGLVAQVEALTELSATGSIDGADILDVCVDTGAEWCALWEGRDAAWGWDALDAEDVEEEELNANGEEHCGRGHGEDADRRVVGTCTTAEN